MSWTVVAGSGFSGREFGMSESERRTRQGADYENVGSEYLEQRQLRTGAAGWVLLAGLGVAYVISGDFAGWHFGLAEGGWGGLLIATVLMATMYTAMVFALAELSSTIPTAGGGYGFAGRVHDGDGDPDRVRHRPGGYRHVYRGLRGDPHRDRRVDRLPGLLPNLRRHSPLRRRGGAQVDVRDHGRGRRGARGVRDRHDPTVRSGQSVHHRPDWRCRRELLLAVRGGGHLGGFPVRDLVLPRNRRRAARRRGDPGSIDRHAQRAHRRHGGAASVRGASPAFRSWRGRFGGVHERRDAGRAVCTTPGIGGGLRRRQRARNLRQYRGAHGPDRELLLDHLRLLAPDVRPFQGRLPPETTLDNQWSDDALDGPDSPWCHWLPSRAYRRRGDPDQHRRLRRDDLLCADDALAHSAAPARTGPGAPLSHAGRRGHLGCGARAGGSCGHRDLYRGCQGCAHHARGLCALPRLFRPLQSPPPRRPGAGGRVRHYREGRVRAGRKLERSKNWTRRRRRDASTSTPCARRSKPERSTPSSWR